MGRHEKLIAKLKTRPRDFTFTELESLLAGFGCGLSNSGKTSGSAVRFVHPEFQVIRLHKPHPGNELKRYVIDDVIEKLESEGLI
jgi:hypothetical protein